MRKKCPYSGFFWSAFSRIRTEYGEIRRDTVRIPENIDQKNSEYGVTPFDLPTTLLLSNI